MSNLTPADDDEQTRIPDKGGGRGSAAARTVEPAAAHNALPIGTRLGEFEITGLVGEGGFGIVYLVYDHSLQRKVALKEYMPSSFAARFGEVTVGVKSERHADTFAAGLRSFINEARLLAQFDHPSLLKVHRFWEANGTGYMVMPFYEGLTLKQALSEHDAAPSEAWLKNLLAPLLDAVEVLHRASPPCVHRDISPDNILLLKDDHPLLLDFGAARRVISDMAQALTVMLKPGYAPIEQYAEEPSMKQGPWTDIYALAAVVYFAITGRAPMPSVSRLVTDSMVPLSTAVAGRYRPEFLRAIDTALAVKPQDRPQTIAAFRRLLGLNEPAEARAVRFEDAGTIEPSTITAPESRHRGWLWPAIIGGITGVALLGGGIWWSIAERDRILSAPATTIDPAAPAVNLPAAPTASEPVPAGTARVTTDPASPGAPTSPTVRPATGTYDPLIALDEVFQARDPQHLVTVAVERPRVNFEKSEPIEFSVSSAKQGFVYVLEAAKDRDGKYSVLLVFPNSKDRSNRISPGVPMDLPRKNWNIIPEGPPGIDQFLVIVSDSARDFTTAGMRSDGTFPRDIAAQRYRSHTGATPLFAGKARCAPDAQTCPQAYGAAQFSVEEVDR